MGSAIGMGGILVVDRTTADPGIPGVTPIVLDEDHISICKPASKDALVYRQVRQMIEELLTTIEPATPMMKKTPANSEPKPEGVRYPGPAKTAICDRLHGSWATLADYLEIPAPDRRRFERGREPQGCGNGWRTGEAWLNWSQPSKGSAVRIWLRSCAATLARPAGYQRYIRRAALPALLPGSHRPLVG